MLRNALEAEPVAARLRPRERWNDRYTVLGPIPAERRAAVTVPLLHGVGHIHVKAEIRREHAFIWLQHVQIRTWALPEPLELVIVYEEVAPEVGLVCRLGRLRVIEALKVARTIHLYRR